MPTRKFNRHRGSWLAIVILFICTAAQAQQDSGGIVVTVTDPGAAMLPNAHIAVTNNGTSAHFNVMTNSLGSVLVTPLPVGDYQIIVEKQGFSRTIVSHVTVQLQQNTRVPIILAVGNVAEETVVTTQLPILQTEDTSVGQTIDAVLKDNLPVIDRSFNHLAPLTIGVNMTTPSGPRDSGTGFSANGVSQYQNNYILDGTDNNSYDQNVNEGRTWAIEPSLDAIAEFRVQTNSYSAEFGRDGGAVINVITKAGSNHFHGSAYEYLQNSSLNTNDFFNNALKIAKPDYKKNIFGASLGGPVWIPKVYNGHDKTFFFADFEMQPYRSPGAVNKGLIPTPAEASGDFSSDATIYDPTTGKPFPGNKIPTNRISTIASKIAAAIPTPNLSGANNYLHSGAQNTDDNRVAVRIDHQLTQRDTIFGRYQYQHQNQPQVGLFAGTILTGDDNNTADAQGVVGNWIHTFSANLINDARFGWTRLNWLNSPANSTNVNEQVGIGGVPVQGGLAGGLASITFSNGLSSFGGSYSEQDLNGTYQVSDTVTWMKGRHALKMGGTYRRIAFLSAASSFAPNGEFDFDGHYTGGGTSVGNPFADFLLDLPNQSRLSAIHTNDYQRRAYSLFVQDTYKATAKLTLNMGLRWDYVTPVWEQHNHGAILDPNTRVLNLDHYTGAFPDSTQRQINAGIFTVNNNANRYFGVQPDRHDFAPRVGFSYLVTPTTVFSAGYGLFFGPEQLGPFGEPSPGFSTPFLAQATYAPANSATGTLNPVTMDTGFPSSALTNPTGTTLFATQLNLRTPYFSQWNATAQQQLSANTSLDIAYIGSKTTAMYTTMDWNIPAIALNNSVPYAQRQPFPDVDANGNLQPGAAIQGPSNDGMGTYNALGLKFQSHMRNGLSMISSYTWAHDIDNITNSGLSVGNNGRGNYPWNQNAQRGNSDWNITNRWVTAFHYELPFGHGKTFGSNINRMADAFIGGWQLGGILTVESGNWYTVNQNFDSANNGLGSFCGTCRQRPDVVPGQNPNKGPRKVDPTNTAVHWFNVNAFQFAANGTVGNSRRNSVVGPAHRQFDASLAKQVSFTERANLQLRLEAFNATNTTNFLVDSGTTSPTGFWLGNSNFGVLNADRGGRVAQIVARFVF